jgi:CHAT domain-containing protein/tetratricopeptide (TPR) repeat protein
MNPIRVLYFLLVTLAALFVSCAKEQQATTEQPGPQQLASGKAGATAEADTAPAGLYFAQAEQLVKAAKYDSAIFYFEQASLLYQAGKNWGKYVRCYNKIGDQYRQKGKFDEAFTYSNQALETGLKYLGAQHPEIASSYSNLGHVYFYRAQYDQALKSYQQALQIRRTALGEQHPDAARSYSNIGNVYLMKGDYDQAITFHKKDIVIKLATIGEQHMNTTLSYLSLGSVYIEKGDYDEAIAVDKKALSILLQIVGEQHPNVAMSYYNISDCYLKKGDYDQAISLGDKAASIIMNMLGKQDYRVATCYILLGRAYSDKDDYDQALAFFDKALSIQRASLGEQHFEVAATYHSMAAIYDDKRDYKKALAFHNKALAIRTATLGDQHPNVADSYVGLGDVHLHLGGYRQAFAFYQKALLINLATLGKHHPAVALCYNNLGRVYELKGEYGRAIDFYQQALRANIPQFTASDPDVAPPLNGILSESELLKSLSQKAPALSQRYTKQSHDLRDLESAVAVYQVTSQLIDLMRSSYKAEGSKLFLAERATNIYDQAIQTALRLYQATQKEEHKNAAFIFAEKNKAGVMLDALSEAEAKQFAGIPDSLLANERQLRIDLAFYEKSLTEEQLKRRGADSAKVALWQDKVFALKQSYDALLQRLEKEYPDYYNLKYQIKTVSAPEAQQQLLDDKTALVEYFTGKDSIFIFAVTKNDFAIEASAKDPLFERQIEQLREGIIEKDFAQYTLAAHHLYQTLLEPVADKITDKNLVVVPDGLLSAIPFETLLAKAASAEDGLNGYADLPYLMNAHAISYVYSATLLQQEQSRKNRATKRDYLAFAPVFTNGLPAGTRGADFFKENFANDSSQTATATATRIRGYLPSTKKEVTAIGDRFKDSYNFFERWFGNKANVYLEREANETALKAGALGDYRILHFATHGLVNEENPKLSGLILSPEDPASREDGILHLGEIYNLNLNADLVVLSACETGLGQVAKGEGIIGLTRGFLYAGAANLLVSLWQVSDATTADLMVDFYDKMLGGMSKPEALREAKLQMIRRHAEYAKPYYWAPFILVGK